MVLMLTFGLYSPANRGALSRAKTMDFIAHHIDGFIGPAVDDKHDHVLITLCLASLRCPSHPFLQGGSSNLVALFQVLPLLQLCLPELKTDVSAVKA